MAETLTKINLWTLVPYRLQGSGKPPRDPLAFPRPLGQLPPRRPVSIEVTPFDNWIKNTHR